jgi:RimJ/RimL family protein N-acetyltransferase
MAPIDIQREALDTPVGRQLIAALDTELQLRYPEVDDHVHVDPAEVADGRGAFVVAYDGQAAVGCGAIRRIAANTAELKRMYVVPARRGQGVGAAIIAALEDEARALGASHLVLETGVRQPEAIALYRRVGYTAIPPFGSYVGPPISQYFGKGLDGRPAARVALLQLTPAMVVSLADLAAFERSHGVTLGPAVESVRQVAAQDQDYRARMASGAAGWGGYLVVDERRRVIGTCGFKGAPEDEIVEIAYFTFPPFEGRGFATAMATALIQVAGTSRQVARVRAHTLAEENASSRLLRRLRFDFEGVVEDPEDGPVWRWGRAILG